MFSAYFGSSLVMILLSVEFHTASCDTFYILPTPSSHCPGEFTGVPCLTLQQYALNPSRSQNITFLFQPGIYNHSTRLTVSNGYNFTMSSSNATVICTSTAGQIYFNRFQNVHVSGMAFQECHNALRMNRVTRATVTNCHFDGNRATGGRYAAGSCLFVEQSSVIISWSNFQNNIANYLGGAVYAVGSTIIVNSCTFNRTRLVYEHGGAIFGRSGSNVIVDNSTFSHNYASWDGGAIFCQGYVRATNTVFYDNRARSGGAIYTLGRYPYVIDCQFINNSARVSGGAVYKGGGGNDVLKVERNYYANNRANSFGGAVYVVGTNSSVSVSGSSFINNMAVGEGGGVIYSNGRYANITLSSSTFTNNSASYCSVLDVDDFDHFSVSLTNSVFKHNTATGQTIGGGVACIRNASINISDSVFKHNFANYHAGVFYIDESVTTVDGSLFINNSAALDGGVFYTYVHASDYIIRRSQFSDNSAGDDGGVMSIGRLNSFVSIDESLFDFNSAADRGGVIALIASSIFMEINRTNIFNNTAQFGGVMSACNSQVTLLDDSLFVAVDPLLSFCMLYGGEIRYFNITIPDPEVAITTAPPTTPPATTTPLPTTAPPTTTEPPITSMLPITSGAPLTMSSMAPSTTLDATPPQTTSAPLTTGDKPTVTPPITEDTTSTAPPTSTVEGKADMPQPTPDDTAINENSTTELPQDDDNVSVQITESSITIIMYLSTISFAVSLVAIVAVFVLALLLFMRRKSRYSESKKEVHEINEFSKNDFTMID